MLSHHTNKQYFMQVKNKQILPSNNESMFNIYYQREVGTTLGEKRKYLMDIDAPGALSVADLCKNVRMVEENGEHVVTPKVAEVAEQPREEK